MKNKYIEKAGYFLGIKRFKKQRKIFVIGRNKTGTTSVMRAFKNLGYAVGHQRTAEELMPHYKEGNFNPILQYCESAQVFQDFPFSYPKTFEVLEQQYPDALFILTTRNSAEQWYNSLVKFHSKLFGQNGNVPTAEDLQNAEYVWKGWLWECNRIIYQTPIEAPYQKQKVIQSYIDYNNTVRQYFEDKPDKLLEINIGNADAYQKFIDFLGIKSPFDSFPWENKTANI